ncbi:DUF4244 domain-containing protein [uncultured Actinomyces sp.]|uniref:DUF4244 domain-containing protein n=1 Tax=uncultured Actinomyces sp. TaxID=249061 RepID=UPI00262A3050|nr:DUF4244 domain-containing protein [uncultured Actinomyces sp.]
MSPQKPISMRMFAPYWPDRSMRGNIDAARRDLDEGGFVTAEYAVGILAAVAFAGVLLAVLKSGAVKSMLTSIIQSALSV